MAVTRKLLAHALAAPDTVRWHFSSSEAIGHLLDLAPGADWSAASALATHPRIAEHARGAGFGLVERVPVPPESLARWWRAQGLPVTVSSPQA